MFSGSGGFAQHLASVPQPPVTVAIIDDHDAVHAGIQAWCAAADPPIMIVGAFAGPQNFFAQGLDASNNADVVVLDVQFANGRPDFETLRKLRESGRRVIVYSRLDSDEVILTSLDLGAVSYLSKSESKDHLIEAINAAGAGIPYVGPRMAKAVANDQTSSRIRLSDREREVLIAWFQTESKELVGRRLHIAPTTVRTHLQRARAKYAAAGRPANTKSAFLARAIEDGILGLSDLCDDSMATA